MKILFIKNKSLKCILLFCVCFFQSNAKDTGDIISPLGVSISSFVSTKNNQHVSQQEISAQSTILEDNIRKKNRNNTITAREKSYAFPSQSMILKNDFRKKSDNNLNGAKKSIHPVRTSMRPRCCYQISSYPSILKQSSLKDTFLLFSCYGKTQSIATMAIASVFLDKLNEHNLTNKILFSDHFRHIVGFSAGSIPAALSSLGYSFEAVNTSISPLI